MEVNDFNSWWKQNKERYESLGITSNIALEIWIDAIECYENQNLNTLLNANNHIK